MSPDEVMRDGVKRSAKYSTAARGHRHERPRPLKHLARRATREGQQGRPFLQLRDIPADKESNYPPVDLLVTS